LSSRNVFERETTKESEFRHLALSRIERSQLVERSIQIQQIDLSRVMSRDPFVECHPRPSPGTLGHLAPPRMVNEDVTHHLRGDRQEVRSIPPARTLIADQAKVDLVHQRGRLQHVAWLLTAESRRRPPAKLLVNHGDKLISSSEIASLPSAEKPRHVAAGADHLSSQGCWILTVVSQRVKPGVPRQISRWHLTKDE